MNTNCLKGLRCPKCGYEDQFSIQGVVTLTVTDNGSSADGAHEWSDDSPCQCWGDGCNFFGYVRDLRIENQPVRK